MLWYVGRFLATYKLNYKVESIAHAKEEPTIKPWNDPDYSYSLNSIIGFFLFFSVTWTCSLEKNGIIGDFRQGHEACPCL